jgi:V8-like Glu-specific endopeptidase
MGLLTGAERASLIELLLRLPNVDREAVRRSLVAGLPSMLRLSIEDPGVAGAHVTSIVDMAETDAWSQLPDGSWSVIRIVENAIFSVRGSRLEQELGALLETLKDRAVDRASQPAASVEPTPPFLDRTRFALLEEALLRAFPSAASLRRMLRIGMDLNLDVVAGGGNLREIVFSLLTWAEENGRVAELVAAARLENPGNELLRQASERLGLAPASPPSQQLEPVVERSTGFLDVEAWRARMSEVEPTVCRVEILGAAGAYGTGFLVGPSTAMTCYHVVDQAMRTGGGVELRFGYRKAVDGTVDEGTVYRLADQWLADSSPEDELDYALLRVAGSPGDDPVGGRAGAPARRWLHLATDHVFRPNDPLTVIQHPLAEPLKIAFAPQSVVEVSPDQTRVRYRINTAAGSAGSPCFNENWEVVALHRGRSASDSSVKEGVPMATIAARSSVQQVLGAG